MFREIQELLLLANKVLENLIYLLDLKVVQTFISTIIGSFVTISVFFGTQIWTSKREKKKQREAVLNVITQTHKDLFSTIYEASHSKNSVDYLNLRNEYKRIGLFIYMMPNELKIHFNELYEIHCKDQDFYKANQHRIHQLCKKIIQIINKYGVDVFG